MWGHYLITLYRSLTRHRLYAALNVLGLAVGVVVFLVLWLDVRFETGFDLWLPNAQTVYRVNSIRTSPGEGVHASADSPSVVGPLLKADYPQIAAYTRVIEDDDPVVVGNKSDGEKVYFVDPDFFKVLDLPLLKGDPTTALYNSGDIVISARIARKYFGSIDVMGAHMAVNRAGTLSTYRIAAVMKDLPADTHLKLDLLVPLTPAFEASIPGFTSWGSIYGPTYVRFRNSADAEGVGADLKNFVNRRGTGASQDKLGAHPSEQLRLELTALPAIHFKDATMEDTFAPGVDGRVVASLGIVGLFTLVIAVLNYINLATARASLRAREVAVRKVLGATQATLMGQFLAEAIAVALLAVLIGLALTELALPLFNAAGGSDLRLTYLGAGGVLPLVVLLVLVIGLGAGLYPALVLSGFQPAPVLAASRMPGGGKLGAQVRNGLVVVQFAAAIGFTICTMVLSAQAKYLHDADRGFTREGLILVDSLSDLQLLKRQNGIVGAFASVPGVKMVSLSDREPAATNIQVTNMGRPGLLGPEPDLVWERVSANYFETYGIGLVAGRTFDPSRQVDDVAGLDLKAPPPVRASVVLNESGVKSMGFASPAAAIGQTIVLENKLPMQVIGVVRDVRFMSPHQAVGPIFYNYKSREIRNATAAIRYDGVGSTEMISRLGAAWSRVAPEVPFTAKTADARLSDYYVPDEQRARLFTSGAVLAVAIGCVGLYGLASFNTARRMKEIGIRKTLGASTTDILRLLVSQFLRPVVLANLLAWPLAFFAMRSWLSSFDQRIGLTPLYFVAATLLTLAIALATIVGQVVVVARAEPAKALRHE